MQNYENKCIQITDRSDLELEFNLFLLTGDINTKVHF